MKKGFLFDMDGVLIDSEQLYCDQEIEAFEIMGLTLTDAQFRETLGKSEAWIEDFYAREFGPALDYAQLRRLTDDIFDRHMAEHGIEAKPGAVEALRYLKDAGYRLCLVTSNEIDYVEPALSHIGGLEYFDAIITGDMAKASKPEPDIYLMGAERLGLSADECYAVEDSPAGLKSAFRAGCTTILIPDLIAPTPEMKSEADFILESLEDIGKIIK